LEVIYAPLPGYVSKLLFPNTPRNERRRKVRTIRRVLVVGLIISGLVALALWLAYENGPH
jgi:hypothetical protein